MNIRLLYIFAFVFVVPPTMIINSKATKTTYLFYRKGLKYGKLKSCLMVYRNHCSFSQAVIDKFAMYAGKKFKMDIRGYDRFLGLAAQPSGFVQLSSHIGNYEIAGYSLSVSEKKFFALVFGGEKESVMENRMKMFTDNNICMITMKSDMSHLFVVDKALTDGNILSMPADRVFGSQKVFELDFLGSKAHFPQGPFTLAALREAPVLFVSVMKVGIKKYHIDVIKIEYDKEAPAKIRAKQIAEKYVSLLENAVRRHPSQWYNYFDFWES